MASPTPAPAPSSPSAAPSSSSALSVPLPTAAPRLSSSSDTSLPPPSAPWLPAWHAPHSSNSSALSLAAQPLCSPPSSEAKHLPTVQLGQHVPASKPSPRLLRPVPFEPWRAVGQGLVPRAQSALNPPAGRSSPPASPHDRVSPALPANVDETMRPLPDPWGCPDLVLDSRWATGMHPSFGNGANPPVHLPSLMRLREQVSSSPLSSRGRFTSPTGPGTGELPSVPLQPLETSKWAQPEKRNMLRISLHPSEGARPWGDMPSPVSARQERRSSETYRQDVSTLDAQLGQLSLSAQPEELAMQPRTATDGSQAGAEWGIYESTSVQCSNSFSAPLGATSWSPSSHWHDMPPVPLRAGGDPAPHWGAGTFRASHSDWDDAARPLVAPLPLGVPQSRKKGQFEHHRSPPTPPPLDPVRNVYITLLPKTMTDTGLALLAGRFGTIESHKAIIDPDTGECKGFGFVMYSTVLEAHTAIEQLNRAGFQASPAKASFTSTLRKYADKDSRNLYLHGIPIEYDENAVRYLLRPHTVVSIRILTEPDGRSRGIALARLLTHEAALSAKTSLHGMRFPDGETLVVRFADSETQRKLKRCVLGPAITPSSGDKILLDSSSSGHEGRATRLLGPARFLELPLGLGHLDDHPRSRLGPGACEDRPTHYSWIMGEGERLSPFDPLSKELFGSNFT